MSWTKMCQCLPCCKKKPQLKSYTNTTHPELPPTTSTPIQVSIPSHHKYTSTLVDIRGALSTPIAP